jgi:hypothetical protein
MPFQHSFQPEAQCSYLSNQPYVPSQQLVSSLPVVSSEQVVSPLTVYTELTVDSSLPRDSSTQVDSSHYNVLTNVQPSMVTSRTTKRNVSAFLLDSDNNSDKDDQENQAILNNN